MRESARNDVVTYLSTYKERQAQKKQLDQVIELSVTEQLLTDISYHLLMAARAITKYTPK